MLILSKVGENSIDRNFASQFSGLLSAHTIADHENSVAQVVTEIVLVVLAHEADVGVARDLDYKVHRDTSAKCYRTAGLG